MSEWLTPVKRLRKPRPRTAPTGVNLDLSRAREFQHRIEAAKISHFYKSKSLRALRAMRFQAPEHVVMSGCTTIGRDRPSPLARRPTEPASRFTSPVS